MEYAALVVVAIVAVYIAATIRIANENERFAVFVMGRFAGLKGPGLVLKVPGASKFHRMALGSEGEVQSSELVLIDGVAVPFGANGSIRAGGKVRIVGFDPVRVMVEPTTKFIVCEKCGHKNAL